MVKIEAENTKAVAAEKLRPVAESSLKRAMMEGDMEHGAVMAGQIAPLVKEQKTCLSIIDDVMSEAKARLVEIQAFEF
jgi:enoyl-[acyl-carrier protein] reductase II